MLVTEYCDRIQVPYLTHKQDSRVQGTTVNAGLTAGDNFHNLNTLKIVQSTMNKYKTRMIRQYWNVE